MLIALDFDGTVVTHSYPDVGLDIGALPVLQFLVNNDHQLLLNTMRSRDHLTNAVRWFEDRQIALAGVNVNPWQKTWTESPKVYAQIYIDDAVLGTPLIREVKAKQFWSDQWQDVVSDRPFVDWKKMAILLEERLKDG
jgi:hypothetical protein